MPFYETVLIARQELSSAQVEKLVEEFQNIITSNDGKIHKTEHWGLRTLAYRIQKNRKGHYALMEIDASAPAVHEMERQIRLHEDVLRYMTLRIDELSNEPSIMMNEGDSNYEKEAA